MKSIKILGTLVLVLILLVGLSLFISSYQKTILLVLPTTQIAAISLSTAFKLDNSLNSL